jgi:hypothetical protein
MEIEVWVLVWPVLRRVIAEIRAVEVNSGSRAPEKGPFTVHRLLSKKREQNFETNSGV